MPGSASRLTKLTAAIALGLIASFAAVDFAEARRAGGGGFGSRGMRTYQAPAPTRTAPTNAAPIERSMTPNTGATQTARPAAGAQNAAQAQRAGGMFGNFGRSMLGGLLVGGLIGMLLGNGLGGMAGMLGLLLQVGVIALVAMFVMRMFANRRQTATAGVGHAGAQPLGSAKSAAPQAGGFGGRTPSVNPYAARQTETRQAEAPVVEDQVEDRPMDVGQEDLDHFEQMLSDIQSAYGREDYAALRKLTTPEAMSYLAEELGEIASSGKRNEVKDVKLLQGDVSEAWREGNVDYATVALRYSAIDVMLDRNSGALVEGNPDEPVESVELWTFTRTGGSTWQLAAIQGTE